MNLLKKKLLKTPYLLLFFLPLLVNPWSTEMFSSFKAVWFYFFIGLLLTSFAVAIFQEKKLKILWHQRLYCCVAAIVVFYLIATLFSQAPLLSYFGDGATLYGSFFLFILLIHFLFSLHFLNEDKNLHAVFTIISFVGGIAAFYGILQFFELDFLPHADDRNFVGRIYSTLGNPNFFAQFLIFPFAISFFKFLESSQKKKLLWFFLLSLLAVTIFLTKSRAVWLALALTSYFIFIKHFFKNWQARLFFVLIPAILALLIWQFLDLEVRSWSSRFVLWETSVKLFLQNPIFGSGLNTFYQGFQALNTGEIYQYEPLYLTPVTPHNQLLKMLVEMGVFGLAAYFIQVGVLIHTFLKKNLQNTAAKVSFWALVSYNIVLLFSFNSIGHYLFLSTFWALFLLSQFSFKKRTLKLRKISSKVFIFLLLLLGLFTVFNSGIKLTADILASQSLKNYFTEPQQSAQNFERVIQLQRYNYSYHQTKLQLFGDESDAKQYLNNFGLISGSDYRYYLFMGENFSQHRQFTASDYYFLLAYELAPNNATVLDQWSDAASDRGDLNLAVNILERFSEMGFNNPPVTSLIDNNNPLFFQAMEKLGILYLQLGEVEKFQSLSEQLTKRRGPSSDPAFF